MNWTQIRGNWKRYSGRMHEKWGWLTGSNRHIMTGQRDQLVGRMQSAYGAARGKLKRAVDHGKDAVRH